MKDAEKKPNAGAVVVENATKDPIVASISYELQQVLAVAGVALVATFDGKVLRLRVCAPEESPT